MIRGKIQMQRMEIPVHLQLTFTSVEQGFWRRPCSCLCCVYYICIRYFVEAAFLSLLIYQNKYLKSTRGADLDVEDCQTTEKQIQVSSFHFQWFFFIILMLRRFSRKKKDILSLSQSPNRRCIASVGSSGHGRVWVIVSSTPKASFRCRQDHTVSWPTSSGFQQFSGYITVDNNKNEGALFYCFVEVEIDPASKPLALWLNRGLKDKILSYIPAFWFLASLVGPGCSSLGVGAFSENGAFNYTKCWYPG